MQRYLSNRIDWLLKSENIILFTAAFSIFPLIIISFFNNPSSDDFCFNCKSRDLGFLEAQLTWYNEWFGRYFSTAILSIRPLVSGSFTIYKVIPLILILSQFFSIYILCSLLFKSLKKKDLIVITSFCMLLYIFQMPTISQGYYWLASSITYQLAIILSIILQCFIIKLLKTNQKKYLLPSLILTFFTIGSNEVSMLLVDSLFGMILLYQFWQFKRINYSMLILFIFAILLSIIVITSPGNVLRAEYYSNEHLIYESFFASILATKNYIGTWMPMIILFMLLLFDYFNKRLEPLEFNFLNPNPIFLVMTIFIVLFGAFLSTVYAIGIIPPWRAINVMYFNFLIGMSYWSFLLFNSLRKDNSEFVHFSKWVRYSILVLIIIKFSEDNNVKTAYEDLLSGKAYDYNRELEIRYTTISGSSQDLVYVSKLNSYPATIFSDDITKDSTDWRNRCYDAYFRPKKVLIK